MATRSQKTYRMNQTHSMSYTEIQADFSRKFRLGVCAKVTGKAGFDSVTIDLQHGLNDYQAALG